MFRLDYRDSSLRAVAQAFSIFGRNLRHAVIPILECLRRRRARGPYAKAEAANFKIRIGSAKEKTGQANIAQRDRGYAWCPPICGTAVAFFAAAAVSCCDRSATRMHHGSTPIIRRNREGLQPDFKLRRRVGTSARCPASPQRAYSLQLSRYEQRSNKSEAAIDFYICAAETMRRPKHHDGVRLIRLAYGREMWPHNGAASAPIVLGHSLSFSCRAESEQNESRHPGRRTRHPSFRRN
jgi:hypothetical protein